MFILSGAQLKTPPRPYIVRNYPSKEETTTKLTYSLSKDSSPFGSTSSLLSSRKPKPISVKALTQNFEKFGASPPPLPQKILPTKPQIPTRSVRSEILKAENKISVSSENISKPALSEARPKPRLSKVTPIEIGKSVESLLEEKSTDIPSTEIVILQLKNSESILGVSLIGGSDENSDIMVSTAILNYFPNKLYLAQ